MFGFNDWPQWAQEGFCSRSGAYASELARRDDVRSLLVVDTPSSYAMRAWRRLNRDEAKAPLRRGEGGVVGLTNVAQAVWTLDSSRILPREAAYEPLYRINGAVHDGRLRRSIFSAMDALGMSDVVLWVSSPLMAKHLGCLGERLSVFDADDDWTSHPQKSHIRRAIANGYTRASSRADVIFACSEALAERFSADRDDVYWQPNGVHFERFSKARQTPADLADLRRPIIGYVGAMQQRVDVDLLRALASRMPDACIVLVGPILTPRHFAPLAEIPNVRLLGERPHASIPAYVGAFDVCVMPHVDDGLTRSMNPLKIYEYLAAGKPVVTSGLAGFDDAARLISRSSNAEEFINLVGKALRPEDWRVVEERMAYARAHSWSSRAAEMAGIVGFHLAERGVPSHRGAA